MAAVSALCAVSVGCGASSALVSPTSDVESALVAYTGEFAARLGLKVRGEITDQHYPGSLEAVGWYQAGVAYYYRPLVSEQVTLEDGVCPAAPACELASGVAAHEVCHAEQEHRSRPYAHDAFLWCCMKKLGTRPTFPYPVIGEPVC